MIFEQNENKHFWDFWKFFFSIKFTYEFFYQYITVYMYIYIQMAAKNVVQIEMFFDTSHTHIFIPVMFSNNIKPL